VTKKFLGVFLIILLPLISLGIDKTKKTYELIYEDVQLLKQKVLALEDQAARNSEDLKQVLVQIKDLQSQLRLFQSDQTSFKESLRSLPNQYQVFLTKLEELNQQLLKISEDLSALKGTAPATPAQEEKPGKKVPAPSPEEKTPPLPPPPSLSPQEMYNMSYSDYLKGNFDLAVEGFKQYRSNFPNSPLADNALYWIGECYFSQKKFKEAIDQFNDLILNYPSGDKTAAAYLKKGISFAEMGKKEEALSVFKLLISKYPLEEETKIAQQKIKEMTPEK
jgi:tol-pal system protein YbgF